MVPFVERQTELMVLITSEMEEGTDPSDPRVQDLVGVWLECMQSVAGHEVSRETLAKSLLQSSNLSASDLPSPNALSYLGNALAFTDR